MRRIASVFEVERVLESGDGAGEVSAEAVLSLRRNGGGKRFRRSIDFGSEITFHEYLLRGVFVGARAPRPALHCSRHGQGEGNACVTDRNRK